MAARSIEGTEPDIISAEWFSGFYRSNLPTVYGYLTRLCAGDRALAEDLTQDTWFALVRELSCGHTSCADPRWLLSVARSRFIDWARRERRHTAKLALLRPLTEDTDELPEQTDVLATLADLAPMHRLVLLMRYVEDLPVPVIAGEIGRNVTSTNSLLARARAELRRQKASHADG
ncbi:MAG TPA: RNA polymerase sigma factor [Ilumatobacteraceae bacterium]|jgi:RNA polymerase sigma-70 factor (ECF subfamily)|nr:RNA polymerase sigma factor [Ilumatobacteraceae bacterium]